MPSRHRARPLSHGHDVSRACGQRASPLSMSNALLLTRSPLAAHEAWIAQSSVCADARLPHARPCTRTLSLRHTSRSVQRAPSHAIFHRRVDTYTVALKTERTVPCAAGHGSAAAHAACARLQSVPHTRLSTWTFSRAFSRRRAQHTPAHAMSHERADTYVVAFEVERPVT